MNGDLRPLIRVLAWQSKRPAVVQWLEAFALYAIAFGLRIGLGRLHGGNPSLVFYPAIIVAALLLGWPQACVVLCLSIFTGIYLFLPNGMYLLPLGWLFVGGLTIAIITALKAFAEELAATNERQRILFQELQHRVANTLQSVVGTLETARRRVDSAPSDAKRILAEGAQRYLASADVHRRLNDPALFDRGLKPILQDAVTAVIDIHCTNIGFDIEPLRLSFDQMTTITMIVIEIANNAQKHVFERNLGWHFLVSLRGLPNSRAVLSVQNDGPSWFPGGAGDSKRTLGMTLLEGLAVQLGGKLQIKAKGGTEVSVIFPISSEYSANRNDS